jgi:hypothetical protein
MTNPDAENRTPRGVDVLAERRQMSALDALHRLCQVALGIL